MNSTLQSCICIVEISDSLCIFGHFRGFLGLASGNALGHASCESVILSLAFGNNLRTELVT